MFIKDSLEISSLAMPKTEDKTQIPKKIFNLLKMIFLLTFSQLSGFIPAKPFGTSSHVTTSSPVLTYRNCNGFASTQHTSLCKATNTVIYIDLSPSHVLIISLKRWHILNPGVTLNITSPTLGRVRCGREKGPVISPHCQPIN